MFLVPPMKVSSASTWPLCGCPRPALRAERGTRGLLGDAERTGLELLMPFLQLATIHIAGSHLSRPMGESSKMVPTLTENCLRHPRQVQTRRVEM